MNETFPFRDININLRNNTDFISRNVKTVRYGTESLSYLAPKIWNLLPNEMRDSSTLASFKEKIKLWVPDLCPCRLCKNYIHQVGFVETLGPS